MTTILGIKTNEGKEGVILAADTKLAISKEGEIVREKKQIKLRTRGHQWAMADAGFDDKYSQKFISYLHATKQDYGAILELFNNGKNPDIYGFWGYARAIHKAYKDMLRGKETPEGIFEKLVELAEDHKEQEEPETQNAAIESELVKMVRVILNMEKDPVLQAIRTKHFTELEMLNRHYLKGDDHEYDETVELLIATSKGTDDLKPRLYKAIATGEIIESDSGEDLEYFCVGSGSDAVQEYFDKEYFDSDPEIAEIKERLGLQKIEYGNISIQVAKCLAVGAMARANKEDPNTGPYFDIAEITRDGIEEYGGRIQEKIDEARKAAIFTELFRFTD